MRMSSRMRRCWLKTLFIACFACCQAGNVLNNPVAPLKPKMSPAVAALPDKQLTSFFFDWDGTTIGATLTKQLLKATCNINGTTAAPTSQNLIDAFDAIFDSMTSKDFLDTYCFGQARTEQLIEHLATLRQQSGGHVNILSLTWHCENPLDEPLDRSQVINATTWKAYLVHAAARLKLGYTADHILAVDTYVDGVGEKAGTLLRYVENNGLSIGGAVLTDESFRYAPSILVTGANFGNVKTEYGKVTKDGVTRGQQQGMLDALGRYVALSRTPSGSTTGGADLISSANSVAVEGVRKYM